MNKKIILGTFLIVLVLFINSMVQLEYDMNIVEYLTSDSRLTEDDFQYLKSRGTLIYGADHNSPPLRYINENTKQYEGLSIDYLSALSMELGVNIEFKPMMWTDALEALKIGDINLCDMYPSEERSRDYLFSDPIYYQRGAILVHKKNQTILSAKDLDNKTISGNKGDFVFEFVNEQYTDVTTIEASDLSEAIKLLVDGKVDAVLGDESVMEYLINMNQLKNEYMILDDYLYEREAVLAVPKDDKTLLDIFNKAIKNLNKKRTMENINNKWFGTTPLITKSDNQNKTLIIGKYILLLIVLFILLMYAWNLQLKKEVRKHTTELRKSKSELETVFNGLTNLMIVLDDSCHIVDGNKAFCEKYHLNHSEIAGMHCDDINGILGRTCEGCIIYDTFKTNSPLIREVKHDQRIYKVATFVLEEENQILIMMEDVTDFKITEEKMLQSTKMAAIGQLSAGIAHEIRTPLGIIRNNLYYMKKSQDKESFSESIEVIESSVQRSNKIIDNLLNFSKLTDNTIEKINLFDLIQNIILLNKKNFTSKQITCLLNCEKDLSVEIYVESLKHVIINLINNAVDAMIHGGKLIIDISYENELIIKITDNGQGISEESLNQIFDPFFTTKSSGTGLGLYITYNEVLKMQGTIQASSQENVGTTFTIKLPLEQEVTS